MFLLEHTEETGVVLPVIMNECQDSKEEIRALFDSLEIQNFKVVENFEILV